MTIKKIICIAIIIFNINVFAAQTYKYSQEPLKVTLSNRQNHIYVKNAKLSDVIGPMEAYNIIFTDSPYITLVPNISHGKIDISLVASNGLVQDLQIHIRDIAPQKVEIDMSNYLTDVVAKVENREELVLKNFVKYINAISSNSMKHRKQVYPDLLLSFGETYHLLNQDKDISYKGFLVKVKNNGEQAVNLYSPEVFKKNASIAAMHFDKVFLDPKEQTTGIIVFNGNFNITGIN